MRVAFLAVLVALAATPAASPTSLTPVSSALASNVGFDDSPLDWSPDGRIAFGHTRQPPESSVWAPVIDIGVMNADGSGKRLLAPKVRRDIEEWDYAAHWSPDGALATFVRVLGTEASTLHVVRADGTGLRPLTDTGPNDGAGIWSPDGLTIAFGRFDPQAPSQLSGIWLVRPDGTGLRQLTQGEDFGPVWSPDGRSIAFDRLSPERTETAIFAVDVAVGTTRQLTAFGRANVNQWSADGTRLMFESPGGSREIRTMRPDGTERRKLVDGYHRVWSPDGKSLLFVRSRVIRGGIAREEVYAADAFGRNARRVFSGARYGIWSREGTRIAVASTGPCNGLGVYVVRVSTRRARRISNDCRVFGTPRADRLLGTRERDLIWGRAGNDFIDASPGNRKVLWRLDHNFVDGGAGNDVILGRMGQDVLIGGPGRDLVSGGGQDDRILVRDGEVDVVRCSWGNADTVVADRFDVVAADCERVRRR